MNEKGESKNYDMTAGKYSLVVTSGKAFDSKRSETFDTMQQVIANNPNAFPIIADIFFKNSDLAGGDQLAERFHKMLPPPLQDQNEAIPPQAQAQIAQAQQQAAGMQAELQKLSFEKQAKTVEHTGKLAQIQLQSQADMALEKMKLENALAIAEVQTKAQSMSERAEFIEDLWKQFHGQAHDVAMAAQQHQQALTQQQQSAASPEPAERAGRGTEPAGASGSGRAAAQPA